MYFRGEVLIFIDRFFYVLYVVLCLYVADPATSLASTVFWDLIFI